MALHIVQTREFWREVEIFDEKRISDIIEQFSFITEINEMSWSDKMSIYFDYWCRNAFFEAKGIWTDKHHLSYINSSSKTLFDFETKSVGIVYSKFNQMTFDEFVSEKNIIVTDYGSDWKKYRACKKSVDFKGIYAFFQLQKNSDFELYPTTKPNDWNSLYNPLTFSIHKDKIQL